MTVTSTEPVAGRELDALVAEKVMGWKRGKSYGVDVWRDSKGRLLPLFGADAPRWSVDIAAAWEVIEKMWDDGEWRVTVFWGGDENRWWGAEFAYDANHLGAAHHALYDRKHDARADTAPLAICLAALKAMEADA